MPIPRSLRSLTPLAVTMFVICSAQRVEHRLQTAVAVQRARGSVDLAGRVGDRLLGHLAAGTVDDRVVGVDEGLDPGLDRVAVEGRLGDADAAGEPVTPLSVMRRPGTTLSSTLLLEFRGAPPSSDVLGVELAESGVVYAASSLSIPPETVKSDSEPVLREDMTRR